MGDRLNAKRRTILDFAMIREALEKDNIKAGGRGIQRVGEQINIISYWKLPMMFDSQHLLLTLPDVTEEERAIIDCTAIPASTSGTKKKREGRRSRKTKSTGNSKVSVGVEGNVMASDDEDTHDIADWLEEEDPDCQVDDKPKTKWTKHKHLGAGEEKVFLTQEDEDEDGNDMVKIGADGFNHIIH
ncbi:MAG: hypothetical protein MMC33_005985 [Icmadophila ericetorum]|nr:hypothetical protein [Icmadophila ericetorum]